MMITILLLHGLCSLFLVGALSHQAAATWRRARWPGARQAWSPALPPCAATAGMLNHCHQLCAHHGAGRRGVWPLSGGRQDHAVSTCSCGPGTACSRSRDTWWRWVFLLLPYLSLWEDRRDAAQLRSKAPAHHRAGRHRVVPCWQAILLNNLKGDSDGTPTLH